MMKTHKFALWVFLMKVSIKSAVFEAVVDDNLDFDQCRELMLSCKAHAASCSTAKATIHLQNIGTLQTCAIATLSLISDWMPGGMEINLHHCGSEVKKVFDLGLLEKHFSKNRPLVTSICHCCLESNNPSSVQQCARNTANVY